MTSTHPLADIEARHLDTVLETLEQHVTAAKIAWIDRKPTELRKDLAIILDLMERADDVLDAIIDRQESDPEDSYGM